MVEGRFFIIIIFIFSGTEKEEVSASLVKGWRKTDKNKKKRNGGEQQRQRRRRQKGRRD